MRNPEWRFLFDLALELKMSVTRLMTEVPSWELTEWAGYYKIRAWEAEVGSSAKMMNMG